MEYEMVRNVDTKGNAKDMKTIKLLLSGNESKTRNLKAKIKPNKKPNLYRRKIYKSFKEQNI